MYDYSGSQRSRRTYGLAAVIVLHLLLIWGLVSGLARDVVKLVKHKVEVKMIEEAPPPPPPPPPPPKIEKATPPKNLPPPPPQQAYVPPPEVTPPVVSQSAITSVKADPAPPPPPVPTPAPAPAPAPPAPVVPKGPVKASGVCSVTEKPEYPRRALNDEIEGSVYVRFKVNGDGVFTELSQISFKDIPNAYRSAFQSSISTALRAYRCSKDLGDTPVEYTFIFKVDQD